tara:strand:- start:66 stop:1724 length:1659 start_codon:yes stop_codon:yes gene_type:complete
MSSWGMNEGSALTGTFTFTNGSAKVLGNTSAVLKTEAETGDVLVGADGKLYRIIKRSHARTVATSAVTTGTNTFTLAGHGFATGDEVTYDAGGGTVATGLTDGQRVFVIKTDANDFKVAATAALAAVPTPIGITGTGNNDQNFESVGAGDTACTIDRNYEGGTASGETVTRSKFPRNIKLTQDDGTGHTFQTLGIFGMTDAESTAGIDNIQSVALSGTSSIGRAFQSGTAHRTAPAVTVAAPFSQITLATANVDTTNNTMRIDNHGFRTGTQLTYNDGTGSAITNLTVDGTGVGTIFVIAKETDDSGTTFGTLNSNTFAIALSLSAAQAGTALNLGSTGNATQKIDGVTATATAILGTGDNLGEVTRIDIAGAGSAYSSVPSVSLAAPATETINLNAAGTAVDASADEITGSSGFYGAIKTGDKITYSSGTVAAPTGISNGAYFLIKSGTSNKFSLASTRENALEGTKISLTDDGADGNSTFIGETPTAVAALGLGVSGNTALDLIGSQIAHIGWVKKTIGTGGRAGRVHYETLVAASSISGDSEDLVTPDA